ncbi:hypothetical protein ACVWYQ_003478 [Bradyrhizobium sp. USDA 3397]
MRVLGIPMIDRHPVEPGAETTRGLIHELAGKAPQAPELAGIIGRDDEPEMMPVVFTTLGKGAASGLIAGGVKQSAGLPIPGHPIALKVTDMGTQRARRTHAAHHPRLDHGTAGAVVQEL